MFIPQHECHKTQEQCDNTEGIFNWRFVDIAHQTRGVYPVHLDILADRCDIEGQGWVLEIIELEQEHDEVCDISPLVSPVESDSDDVVRAEVMADYLNGQGGRDHIGIGWQNLIDLHNQVVSRGQNLFSIIELHHKVPILIISDNIVIDVYLGTHILDQKVILLFITIHTNSLSFAV